MAGKATLPWHAAAVWRCMVAENDALCFSQLNVLLWMSDMSGKGVCYGDARYGCACNAIGLASAPCPALLTISPCGLSCPVPHAPSHAGFLIRDVNMPPWWRWYSYICSSKYACECWPHHKVTGYSLKSSAWTQHGTACDRGQGAGLGAGCVAVAGVGRLAALNASAPHTACEQSPATPWCEQSAHTGQCGVRRFRLAWLVAPTRDQVTDMHACMHACCCCAGGAK